MKENIQNMQKRLGDEKGLESLVRVKRMDSWKALSEELASNEWAIKKLGDMQTVVGKIHKELVKAEIQVSEDIVAKAVLESKISYYTGRSRSLTYFAFIRFNLEGIEYQVDINQFGNFFVAPRYKNS